MKVNEHTRIVGKNVILIPYKEIHVKKYHDWMQSPELQHYTASEPLTLEQEYAMQKSWLQDEDKCTFIILDKSNLDITNNEIGGTYEFIIPVYRNIAATLDRCNWKCPPFLKLDISERKNLEDFGESWSESSKNFESNETLAKIFGISSGEISREKEAMIGDTNLFFNNAEDQSIAEAEIMIADDKSRGKRMGWEAMILMLRYGIEKLKVKCYEVKISMDNEKSIKMFNKLQFREVERSSVFQEITFSKECQEDWLSWLISETPEATRDESYE